jgi:hypothetical protein
MYPSVAEYERELAAQLERTEPLPLAAVVSAMRDPRYRRFLLRAKRAPRLLEELIRNAPFAEDTVAASAGEVPPHSAGKLALRAASSLLKWSIGGFRQLDEESYARRIAACRACPMLGEAPDSLAYRAATAGTQDGRICTACGCVAERKARLPHEKCPLPSPVDASKSRWGEQYTPVAVP